MNFSEGRNTANALVYPPSYNDDACFSYKHMKFWNQARLCLEIYNFDARIMLSLCLTFQGTRLPE